MSGGEDIFPPPDTERRPRSRTGVTILSSLGITIFGVVASISMTWGGQSERVENLQKAHSALEKKQDDQAALIGRLTETVNELKISNAVLVNTNANIAAQLEAINRKLDRSAR